ncbi:MAG: hypothetical protein SGBAC_006310 [Bacillariaceae sp.]
MSFSVRNRAAMFEKPGRVDTEAEMATAAATKVVASPVSPAKSTASFVSSMSHKSASSAVSPIGSGPYKSYRNNPRRGEGSPRTKTRSNTPNRSSTPQRSAAEQGSTAPKRATTPQRSSTPKRSASPLKLVTQQRSASPSPRGSTVSTRVSSPQSTEQQRSASPSPRGSTVSTRVTSPNRPTRLASPLKSTTRQRSASPSPRGSTVSMRVSSTQKSTAQQRSASPSLRESAVSTRVTSPRKSLSPRKKPQTKSTGKIVSPFLSDASSKPAVLPLKSPTKPRGWGTTNLKSSGLVSKSPFKTVGSGHSRDATESRESTSHSWSKKSANVETRDSVEKRDDSSLKNSLDAASVVMEEEKSQAGSSNASSRSSLSAKELSDVAKRALDIAKRKPENSKPVESTMQTLSQGSKLSGTPSLLNNPSSQRSTSPYRGRNVTPSVVTKVTNEDDNKSNVSASWGTHLKPVSPVKALSPRKAPSPSASWLSKSASPSKGSQVAPPSPKASPAKKWEVKTAQPSSPRFTPQSSAKKFLQPSSSPRHTPVSSPKADVKSISPTISAPQSTASGRAKSRAAAVAAARKNRAAAKSTNSAEARRAILASTMQKKEKKGEISKLSDNAKDVEVSARLGMKASRVLAMKNSQGNSDHNRDEIGSSVSVGSSSRSRRVDHPAFAARGHTKYNSEKGTDKPFSTELMSSFRHFSAARVDADKSQHKKSNAAKVDSFGFPEQEDSMHSTNVGFTPRNEENIYLNNFSMMSSMHDQVTPSQTGMRTTRSNHSMAQSMISTTPTGHRKANGEFDYMLKTPTVSQRSTLEPAEGNAATDSKSVHSVATGKITNSPPGFVLKEGGDKHVVGASAAANANDEFIDQFFNGTEQESPSLFDVETTHIACFPDHDADAASPKGSIAGTDVSEPLAMEALNLPEDSHGEESEDAKETSSSKRSVNTSIRTGLSSIQNDLTQDNGSKSMRSGLSGIFPENSQHKSTNQTKPLPDTIREEEEREVLSAIASQACTQAREGERETVFDGASFQSKALKDGQTDTLFEGVSHASSQKSGSWWKGKKVKTSLKNALSKKSPRNAYPVEDDIFGDLEEENKTGQKEKKRSRTKTPQSTKMQRQTKKVTPKSTKVEPHDRSGTKLELEENTDVESEITTSILGDGKKQMVDRLITARNVERSTQSSHSRAKSTSEKSVADTSRHSRNPSIFLNLGCGLGEMLDGTFCNYNTTQTPISKKGDEKLESHTDASNLSVKEEQIWKEWEKRDESESNDSNTRSDGKSSENAVSQSNGNGMSTFPADATSQSIREGTESADGQLVDSDEATAEAKEAAKREETRHSRYSSLSASTPMALSNNQRSLVEKFSKHLSNDGVEVLKLNTKKQWQVRYFTISKEQVALTAHEALKPSGDVAQCPKALLWVKKFSPKSTYGLANVDKYGHGGMMLASLVNIHVDSRVEQKIPVPKKMQDKFKKAVTVTLEYNFDGSVKAVEFLCRDNDQAQFLCTCIRVSRDLLKREESLRLRLKEI